MGGGAISLIFFEIVEEKGSGVCSLHSDFEDPGGMGGLVWVQFHSGNSCVTRFLA